MGVLIPRGIVFPWIGANASIPSDWARYTSLDGKYPKGAATGNPGGVSGGSPTHSHSSPAHSHTLNAHTHTYDLSSGPTTGNGMDPSASGAKEAISDTHTHFGNTSGAANGGTTSSDAITYGAVSNDPPYYTVIFIQAGLSSSIPDNMIGFYDADPTSISNWYKCDGNNSTPNLTDKHLKGAAPGADSGDTGGSTTNIHDISHTHTPTAHTHDSALSVVGNGTIGGGGLANAVIYNHQHASTLDAVSQQINAHSGTLTTAETVEVLHKKLLALQKKTGGLKFQGLIGLWPSTIASIPAGWSIYADMEGHYVKITNTLGDVLDAAGANTHTHAAQSHSHTGNGSHTHTGASAAHVNHGSILSDASNSNHRVVAGSAHAVSNVSSVTANYASANTTADSSSNEPEYLTCIFIKFEREISFAAML